MLAASCRQAHVELDCEPWPIRIAQFLGIHDVQGRGAGVYGSWIGCSVWWQRRRIDTPLDYPVHRTHCAGSRPDSANAEAYPNANADAHDQIDGPTYSHTNSSGNTNSGGVAYDPTESDRIAHTCASSNRRISPDAAGASLRPIRSRPELRRFPNSAGGSSVLRGSRRSRPQQPQARWRQ